jgi:hypothetical protein
MAYTINDLCLPARIDLGVGALYILYLLYLWISKTQVKPFTIFVTTLVVLFWAWVLNVLCKAGYDALSMVLAIGPIILYMMLIAFANELSESIKALSPLFSPAFFPIRSPAKH